MSKIPEKCLGNVFIVETDRSNIRVEVVNPRATLARARISEIPNFAAPQVSACATYIFD